MKVCVFGTFDARHHPRVQVVEEGLRCHGVEVVRCNVPWAAPTDQRVAAMRNPLVAVRLVGRLFAAWRRLRRCARSVGAVDAVIVGYLGVFDVHFARRWFPDAQIVLDHLAPVGEILADRRFGRSLQALGRVLDGLATHRADLVMVDTVERAGIADPARTVVVPVGASTEWFSSTANTALSQSPLRIIFFGLYTPLHGVPVIAGAIAQALAGGARLEVTLIGEGQDLHRCQRMLTDRPEVTWHRWVAPSDLPAMVATHHVCLGIFGPTPKARRVVPNKVYQGAAAGCAIVTSGTPPQRRALSTAATFVPVGDPTALAAVLAELAEDTGLVSKMRIAARALADRRFRPSVAVAPLVERLGTPPRRD